MKEDPSNTSPLRACPQGFLIGIHVQPRASVTELVGPKGSELRIRIKAPPVEGAANEALIRYLAKLLGCPRGCIILQQGRRSRRKTVLVSDPTLHLEALKRRLRLD